MAFYGDSAPTPREVNYYTLTSGDHAAGAATQSLTGLASPQAGNRPGDGGATGDMKPPDDTVPGGGAVDRPAIDPAADADRWAARTPAGVDRGFGGNDADGDAARRCRRRTRQGRACATE